MEVNYIEDFKKNNVGVIVNFFSKQFLEREFNIFQIPRMNFIEYIQINDIYKVVIDSEIYESDHIWYDKDKSGLLAHLKLNNIEIIIIKNSDKKIPNSYLEFKTMELCPNNEDSKNDKNRLSLPIMINEKQINPIKSIKKYDVMYIKKEKIFRTPSVQKFHSALKPEREEIEFDQLSRKLILELIEKIKVAKCLYIYAPSELDSIFLKYLELVAVLQNTVVLYSDVDLTSELALINEDPVNVNLMAIMKKDPHYIDKILLPIQRRAFLENTFIYHESMFDQINEKEKNEKNIEVSVITSTNRRDNLKKYLEQLNKQALVKMQVVLVTHGFSLSDEEKEKIYKKIGDFDLEIIEIPDHLPLGFCLNSAITKIQKSYVAKMDDDDYYYENYLLDSWIAAKYTDADLVGKFSTYTFFEGSRIIINKNKNTRRKYHDFVMGATFFCKSNVMKKYMFSNLQTGEDSDFLKRINEDKASIYADHPYNFCIYRANDLDAHTWKISDLEFMKNSTIEYYEDPEKYLSL